nr:hypothetical protein [Tanacetum cinerariifolium]
MVMEWTDNSREPDQNRINSRQYNTPTVAEVAALITNNLGEDEPTRDIVVNKKDSRPKRILELLPSYMALQYPLLFPYGENGEGINVTMFTDWFDLNERHPPARTLTYAEIPEHYVWHEPSKMWKPRKQRKCIGGTRKTFLYKTIILRLRSEQKIVLAVASSRVSSLLLPARRIAHSSMKVNKYYANEEINTRKQDFNQWVLVVGDGNLPAKMKDGEDEQTWIEIPKKFLINSSNSLIERIVAMYPNFSKRQRDDAILRERAILTPRNDDADAINTYMFDKLEGESITYNSADKICKALIDTLDQQHLYLIKFLNIPNFP